MLFPGSVIVHNPAKAVGELVVIVDVLPKVTQSEKTKSKHCAYPLVVQRKKTIINICLIIVFIKNKRGVSINIPQRGSDKCEINILTPPFFFIKFDNRFFHKPFHITELIEKLSPHQ